MRKHWSYLLFFAVFAIIILLPPAIHGDELLVINNDTAAHLEAFKTNQFLYTGQEVTGHILTWINKVTAIDTPILFMWLNFLVILASGITVAAMIIIITKSWLAGTLSAILITFCMRSTITLFWNGTTFNIQSYLIFLPLLIITLYSYINSKKHQWFIAIIPLCLLILFWHPSLGIGGIQHTTPVIAASESAPIYTESTVNPITTLLQFFGLSNIALLLFCIIKGKGEKTTALKIITGGLVLGSLAMLILSCTTFTTFSIRMAINAGLLFGLLLCLYLGHTLNNNKDIRTTQIITAVIVITAIPNLINWFTMKGIQ